jgi:outer membrane lipoprotein SlyB
MPPGRFLIPLLLLAGCGSDYSADTYATRAVQQVDPVQQGVIVGAREVAISADGTSGAAVGAAAGGIVGAATPGGNMTAALAGVGGGLIGGLFGSTAERAVNDNRGTEYIVRQTDGKLVRVTQRDVPPLPIGQKVLVIAGAQARIVPDYTVADVPPPPGQAPALMQSPVRADPPASSSSEGQPPAPAQAPQREELSPPPSPSPASSEAPASPRSPLVPPEAPLAL